MAQRLGTDVGSPSLKVKKKSCRGGNSDTLFFENLKNLIIQVLEKGEYVESKLKKKVNYLYLKNIILNSQEHSPIIVKTNNDCLFQKIAAVYNNVNSRRNYLLTSNQKSKIHPKKSKLQRRAIPTFHVLKFLKIHRRASEE